MNEGSHTTHDYTKLIVILGPTATGKSDIAVTLAKRFNGEIISADSRQVYKGLDIGTGKITHSEMCGIKHHCLDIADPMNVLTVADWRKYAIQAISDIESHGKLPIVCGGTGYYIDTLLGRFPIARASINAELRENLSRKSVDELFTQLSALDPDKAQTIDRNNKRRLVRAIEIATDAGNDQPERDADLEPVQIHFKALKIGLILDDETLRARIGDRLMRRLHNGMLDEARSLHEKGLSFERMNELGLEYRYMSEFLLGRISETEMTEILKTRIWQYARRQKTWWRKDKDIHWFSPMNVSSIIDSVDNFLKI